MKRNATGLVLAATLLVGGCMSIPGVEITSLPSGGQRITHQAKKFSVDAPPSEWKLKSLEAKADVAWEKNPPGHYALLSIVSSQASPLPTQILSQQLVRSFQTAAQKEENFFRDVSLLDEAPVSLDGGDVTRVVMDAQCACPGTAKFAMKLVGYILRAKEFDYAIVLITFPQHYQADTETVERMLRSFSTLE
jgi:hypothetical protein